MKKITLVFGAIAISAALLIAAGCGSSEKPASQASAPAKTQSSMPNESPAPIVKDLDQQLQDIAKQVKNGQVMDAQKTAGLITSDAEKLVPHLSEQSLKDALHHGSYELKDLVNASKLDQAAIDAKIKSLQDLTKKAATQLQGHSH